MANELIGVDVQGIKELNAKLMRLPKAAQDAANDNVAPYLLNVLKAYPPYKHVSYKTAYGGWKSDKQRRYVMARIREGTIKPGQPNRSQQFAKGWRKLGQGTNTIIVNETPYGKWLMDDTQQASMPRKIGWRTIGQTIKERMSQIVRRADAGVKNALRKLGL